MSVTDDFLKEKLNVNHKRDLIASLKKHSNSFIGLLGNLLARKNSLSKNNAYIGLVLLNSVNSDAESRSDYHWNRMYFEQNSDRFNALKKISTAKNFWNLERFPLLVFLFGERVAPLVKKA